MCLSVSISPGVWNSSGSTGIYALWIDHVWPIWSLFRVSSCRLCGVTVVHGRMVVFVSFSLMSCVVIDLECNCE